MFIIFKHTTSGSCHWKSIYPNQKKKHQTIWGRNVNSKNYCFLAKISGICKLTCQSPQKMKKMDTRVQVRRISSRERNGGWKGKGRFLFGKEKGNLQACKSGLYSVRCSSSDAQLFVSPEVSFPVCLLSPWFRRLTERPHTAGETEKEKEGKKKKKPTWKVLVSCPPKTANTRKDIYLLINWETGIGPSFAALDFIFCALYVPHPPTNHPKSHYPFRLDSWGYDMLPLSPKKKKTIWDGKLDGTLTPQRQWLFGPSSVAQRSSVSTGWVRWTGWVSYPLVLCHFCPFIYFSGLVPRQFCVLQLISFSSFITNQPKKGKKIHF